MKIVAVSDTHQYQPRLPKADIIIFAGDANLVNQKSIDSFLDYCKTLKTKHIIYVAGNHDTYLEQFTAGVLKEYFSISKVTYLQDEAVTIKGKKFYGTPWSPMFNNWAFMLSEAELKDKFRLIPKDTDVLISHSPPHRILDTNDEGVHLGSYYLAERVRFMPLIIHIFGHIHESYGQCSQYYNCSVVNEHYQLVNKPTEIIL